MVTMLCPFPVLIIGTIARTIYYFFLFTTHVLFRVVFSHWSCLLLTMQSSVLFSLFIQMLNNATKTKTNPTNFSLYYNMLPTFTNYKVFTSICLLYSLYLYIESLLKLFNASQHTNSITASSCDKTSSSQKYI